MRGRAIGRRMAGRGAGRTVAAAILGAMVFGVMILGADHALASQGPGVADGTAEPITRAMAAAMALFLPVTVTVFALARLLLGEAR